MKFNKQYQLILENKLEDALNKVRRETFNLDKHSSNISNIKWNTLEKVKNNIRATNALLTNKHKYVDFLIKNFWNTPCMRTATAETINFIEEH